MFQEFFTDTLGSRYIKTLLQETPFPVFDAVVDGDTLVSGCYYVYKQFIIQCQTGGKLAIDTQEKLYPSDILYPSKFLFPMTGYRCATFYVRSIVDFNDPKIMRTYRSTTNYYDPDTHRQLGRYLRYVHSRTGLNLLPFYNCYNHKSIPGHELVASTTNEGLSVVPTAVLTERYKLVAVPILFGKKYTIAIDCPTQVLLRSVIYRNGELAKEHVESLNSSAMVCSRLVFNSPITYSVETDNPALLSQQRNLWLWIQLPIDHKSSIVVLENFSSRQGVYCDEDSVRAFDFINSSLLFMNTDKSFAFSDRLIEYLTHNVICAEDSVTNNVSKVQMALASIPPLTTNAYREALDKNGATLGVWDSKISRTVKQLVYASLNDAFILDQDGNINKDVEQLILSKGVQY